MEELEHIDIGDGVTLTKSTDEDFEFVNAHLREMDEAETKVFDGGRKDRVEDMERAWTIRDGDNIVGFIATAFIPNESPMSRNRYLVELTTDYVWNIKVKYVRFSRAVLRAVVEHSMPWVENFFTMPMKRYAGAVKWDERILGMTRIKEIDVGGEPHVLFRITRSEVVE